MLGDTTSYKVKVITVYNVHAFFYHAGDLCWIMITEDPDPKFKVLH